MVWGGILMEGRTDLYRLGNNTLTAIRYQDKILGFLGSSWWDHVAKVGRHFLEDERNDI